MSTPNLIWDLAWINIWTDSSTESCPSSFNHPDWLIEESEWILHLNIITSFLVQKWVH